MGAVIDGRVLCVHGGLSPELKTIDQIRTIGKYIVYILFKYLFYIFILNIIIKNIKKIIDRKNEIPHEGPFCDLMWSDPEDIDTWALNSRGAGWLFGGKVTKDFNYINGLELIARAH